MATFQGVGPVTDPNKDPVEGDPTDRTENQPGAEADQSKLRADGGIAISNNPKSQNSLNGPSGQISPSIEEVDNEDATTSRKAARWRSTEITASDLEQLERIVLEPLQELCGRLEGIHRTNTQLVIVISSGILKYPLNSGDARICEQILTGNIGDWVSILRSPDTDQSLLICVDERAV